MPHLFIATCTARSPQAYGNILHPNCRDGSIVSPTVTQLPSTPMQCGTVGFAGQWILECKLEPACTASSQPRFRQSSHQASFGKTGMLLLISRTNVTDVSSLTQGNLCHASEEASRRAARTYFESLRRVYKCNTSPSALKKHSHKRAHHRVSLREKRKRAQSIMSSLTK